MKPRLHMQEYFPEIEMIQSKRLKEQIDEVWNDLWNQSAFDDIMKLPVIPTLDYPHIYHNRSVLNHAIAAAKNIERFHHIKLDMDILIASSVLQDAAKLVEFEPTEDGVKMSKLGLDFQHGFFGAHAALKVGVPLEIVRTIVTHTNDNAAFPPTIYSKILFYCDQIDMAALNADTWEKTSVIFRKSPYEK